MYFLGFLVVGLIVFIINYLEESPAKVVRPSILVTQPAAKKAIPQVPKPIETPKEVAEAKPPVEEKTAEKAKAKKATVKKTAVKKRIKSKTGGRKTLFKKTAAAKIKKKKTSTESVSI